jgi:hypothetical protein
MPTRRRQSRVRRTKRVRHTRKARRHRGGASNGFEGNDNTLEVRPNREGVPVLGRAQMTNDPNGLIEPAEDYRV